MILKGSQRGGGVQLARHLLKAEDNEHVEVHELRGFSAADLTGALREAEAVSRGTRTRQFLFSLSLNPPATARVTVAEFEAALAQIEVKLGLDGQPRVVVFHEKDGRRHAHAVWSRIDARTMTAINLAFFKTKLRDVSHALYLEHGWALPRGLASSKECDPRNFTRTEWEQAKRCGLDPRQLKTMFRECWLLSDSKAAYVAALATRGFTLARGDRRGNVAVDFQGEVDNVAKWSGLKTRDMRDRLGDGKDLPSVAEAKARVAAQLTAMLRRHADEAARAYGQKKEALRHEREALVERQRQERAALEERQRLRWAQETASRAERLTRGFRGLWDRLTGARGRAEQRNEAEAWDCLRRDRAEKDVLIARHLDERAGFHERVRAARHAHAQDILQIHRELGASLEPSSPEAGRETLRGQFREAAGSDRTGLGAEGRDGRGGRRGGSDSGRERGRDLGREP